MPLPDPATTGCASTSASSASTTATKTSPNKSAAPLLLRNRAPLKELPLWLANSRASLLSRRAHEAQGDSDAKSAAPPTKPTSSAGTRSSTASPVSKKRKLLGRRTTGAAFMDCSRSPGSIATATPAEADASVDSTSTATPTRTSRPTRSETGTRLRKLSQRTAQALQSLHSRALRSWRPNTESQADIPPAPIPSAAPEHEQATELAVPFNPFNSMDSVHSSAPLTHAVPEDATATTIGVGIKRKRTSSITSTGSDQFWAPYEPDEDKENRRI